jgi:hypothetical protein
MIKTVLGLADDQELAEEKMKDLKEKGKTLGEKLKGLKNILSPESPKQGIGDRSVSLRGKFFRLFFSVGDVTEELPQTSKVSIQKVKEEIEAFVKKYNDVYSTDVAAFKKAVDEAGISFFKPFKPLSMTAEEEKK